MTHLFGIANNSYLFWNTTFVWSEKVWLKRKCELKEFFENLKYFFSAKWIYTSRFHEFHCITISNESINDTILSFSCSQTLILKASCCRLFKKLTKKKFKFCNMNFSIFFILSIVLLLTIQHASGDKDDQVSPFKYNSVIQKFLDKRNRNEALSDEELAFIVSFITIQFLQLSCWHLFAKQFSNANVNIFDYIFLFIFDFIFIRCSQKKNTMNLSESIEIQIGWIGDCSRFNTVEINAYFYRKTDQYLFIPKKMYNWNRIIRIIMLI